MGRSPLSVRTSQAGLAGSLCRHLVVILCMAATSVGSVYQDSRAPKAQTSKPPEVLSPHPRPESRSVPKTFVDLTPAELAKEVRELKHLQPAESQDALPEILRRVGSAVTAFFENFPNTTCTERVISSVDMRPSMSPDEINYGLIPNHTAESNYDLKFNYLVLAKSGADKAVLQEFRTNSKGEQVTIPPQEGVVTIGFAAMFQHFYPELQEDSRFRYLGRQHMKGQHTYVVSFAQRPERARHTSLINFGGRSGTVFLQGVAWIDPVTYGIMRMRTDILKEIGGTGLRKETTDVEYAEVTFEQGNRSMWLPQEVTVSGQLGRYVFHNRHRYSDYRLFVVKAEEKPQSP
jgi:hypothetical protein